MTTTDLVDAFAALLSKHRGIERLRPAPPAWWMRDMEQLRSMPVEMLRALWDCYDGCNSPLGFGGETIHAALNERGDGGYCAI